MLTEMVEYGRKIEEKVKAMQREIKKNIQRINSEGKETRTQINNWDQKEEINIQPKQKKHEFKKNEERLRNPQDNFKHSNIWIIGVPEGEEEDQEIENLLENIMKENFPNLAKEIVQKGSPGSSESPKEVGPKEAHTKVHHNHISQDER